MSFTVTATQGGGTFPGTILAVKVLTGAVAAGGTQTSGLVTSTAGAKGSITPAASNSLPVFSLSQDSPTTAFTAVASNTFYDNPTNLGGAYTAHGYYSGAVSSGTPITVGSSAPVTSQEYGWAIYEVSPSGGSTPALDASSPALVNAAATAVTTAAFNPPAGSVLVALISCFASGSGGVTMALSDTSGLGLTWTQRSGNTTNPQSEGDFIFTATMPGGPAIPNLVMAPRIPS